MVNLNEDSPTVVVPVTIRLLVKVSPDDPFADATVCDGMSELMDKEWIVDWAYRYRGQTQHTLSADYEEGEFLQSDLFRGDLLPQGMALLDFSELKRINTMRSQELFPDCNEWSVNDWITAMVGEAGEAANIGKKIRRVNNFRDGDTAQVHRSGTVWTRWEAFHKLGQELADVVLYADLLATKLGFSLGELVRDKFNLVSEEQGSKRRL